MISNVKRAIATLGDEISVFKAFVDTQLTISKHSSCLSELQSGGVTIAHCPHVNRKEVADRVLVGEYTQFNVRLQKRILTIF